MTGTASSTALFDLAVVVPVHNEAENIRPLIEEISAALDGVTNYEIVYVDDGSTDTTADMLNEMMAEQPRLSVYKHERACGQSAAVATGVKQARATFIATLDGDGQNDPADIPALFAKLKEAPDADLLLVAGWRAKRKDTEWKRFQSKLANGVRSRLLGDNTPDTGCGLKVFTRATFIATLDGDGQNDPADIPALFAKLKEAPDADLLLVAGWRAKRKDTEWKRFQSKLANGVRSRLLGDNTPDTGCGLKVFTRAAFMDMPRFDHMHRYLPALMIRRGGDVVSVEVNHRNRERGISKYGMWDRLSVAVRDLLGVMWLAARESKPRVSVVHRANKD